MLWPERSRSRGIFQEVFLVPIGLYRGNLRPATARPMPARSAFGGPAVTLTRQPSSRLQSRRSDPGRPPRPGGARRQTARRLRDQRAIGIKPVGCRRRVRDADRAPGPRGRDSSMSAERI